MAALNLSAVMDALAAAMVAGGVSRNVHAWPTEAVQTGDGVVGYPEQVDFDLTFARGADRATFPVWVICGLPQLKATRDAVSALITSAAAVKTVLEAAAPGSAYASLQVLDCRPEAYEPIGMPPQMAVRFDVDVIS